MYKGKRTHSPSWHFFLNAFSPYENACIQHLNERVHAFAKAYSSYAGCMCVIRKLCVYYVASRATFGMIRLNKDMFFVLCKVDLWIFIDKMIENILPLLEMIDSQSKSQVNKIFVRLLLCIHKYGNIIKIV